MKNLVTRWKRSAGIRFCLVAACFALVLLQPSAAQVTAYLTVDGDVQTSIAPSEADFKALPRSSVTVKDESRIDRRFKGVDLALVLISTGTPLKADLKGADVAKYLYAEGTDCFAVVFSLPEFDGLVVKT